jgi:hypothetical protein
VKPLIVGNFQALVQRRPSARFGALWALERRQIHP